MYMGDAVQSVGREVVLIKDNKIIGEGYVVSIANYVAPEIRICRRWLRKTTIYGMLAAGFYGWLFVSVFLYGK